MRAGLQGSVREIAAAFGDVVRDENFSIDEDQIRFLLWGDGLLTAAAIGPVPTRPEEWLRAMQGAPAADDDPTMVQALHVMNQIRVEQILASIARRGPKFRISMLKATDEAATMARAEAWARGFAAGMKLRYDAWRPLIEDRAARNSLLPVLAFITGADGSPFLGTGFPDETVKLRREALPLLGEAVFNIYLYWQERREGAPLHAGRLGKVGRNEPCPCGSGNKYKRCCLN